MALEQIDLPEMDATLQQDLAAALLPAYQNLLHTESIDDDLQQALVDVYLPLAHWVAQGHPGRFRLIGLNGAQGAGKSTLAKILRLLLEEGFRLRTEVLSIDDLYLQPDQREELASTVHPLFRTRGVPGTHDMALGLELVEALRQQRKGQQVRIPRFDKIADRRHPASSWTPVTEPLDVLILEGWCVGARPQSEAELGEPINSLEAEQDPQGTWRQASNRALAGEYQALFEQLDLLLLMQVPAFEAVYRWRSLQESKLGESATMGPDELHHFIMHYERLTRAQLQEMPYRADLVLQLDDNHQVKSVSFGSGSLAPE
jgi:D-glycerate 3-kinase